MGITDAGIKVVIGEEVVIAYSDRNKVVDYKPDDWGNVNLPHDLTYVLRYGNEGGYNDVLDVIGYNYGQRGMFCVKNNEWFSERKMIVTEFTSYVSTRGEYAAIRRMKYCSNPTSFFKSCSWMNGDIFHVGQWW